MFNNIFNSLIGVTIALVSNKAVEIEFMRNDYKWLCKWYDIQTNKKFDIAKCTREEFECRCLERHIKRHRIDYAYDLLKTDSTPQELADKYYVAIDTIYQDRWRYTNKLK